MESNLFSKLFTKRILFSNIRAIKESLTLLAKIDFTKYPIVEEGFNLYAKKLKPIVSVCEKMSICFEIKDHFETVALMLNSITDNIGKFANVKIENDNQLKQ